MPHSLMRGPGQHDHIRSHRDIHGIIETLILILMSEEGYDYIMSMIRWPQP